MKIVITNAYTWYNKGDAGILLGTIDVLKKIYRDAEFEILSFTPIADKKKYCSDPKVIDVKSNILNPHPYKHTKIGKIIAMIKLLIKLIIIQTNIKINFSKYKKKNTILNTLDNADLIVVCGGGFLGGKKLDSLMHLYQIYVDTLFDKKVFVMGTSIEPINSKIVKRMTEKVLKQVNYIFAREFITYDYLKTFMPMDKIGLIPDMAFALKEEKHNFSFLSEYNDNIVLGITMREWNFPMANRKEKKVLMNNYIDTISNTMLYYIKNKNAIFIFIPQVIVEYASDTFVARRIKEKLPEKYKERFIIRNDDWSPYEIKALISKFDGFIGTRMHSNIFATSMCVPTIAIAYEKKTNGIMNTLELNDFIVEMDKITKEELISKIEKMLKEKNKISEHLSTKISNLQKEIIHNLSIVLKEKGEKE